MSEMATQVRQVGGCERSARISEVIRRETDLRLVDMYVYADSKPTVYYPENTASDFTVQLPASISGVSE